MLRQLRRGRLSRRSAQPSATLPDDTARIQGAVLATFAEFEVDLLRMRTREGMAGARAKGKLRGKQPKLSYRILERDVMVADRVLDGLEPRRRRGGSAAEPPNG